MTAELTPHVEPSPGDVTEVYDGKIRFFRALLFPFFDVWWSSLLNIVLVTVLQYVPVVGQMIVQGWSVEVSRRVRAGLRPAQPHWDSITGYLNGWLRFLLTGFVVWLIGFLFYTLPCWILGTALFIRALWGWINTGYEWYLKLQNPAPASEMTITFDTASTWTTNLIIDSLTEYGLKIAAFMLFCCLMQLIHAGGMVRYLKTGSLWAFLQPFKNLGCVLWHWRSFLIVLIYWLLLKLILFGVWVVMALTQIGDLFIPLTFAIDFWFLGHLYGQLAARVEAQS